jgi:Putative mono-oxygenase ydhR
MHVAVFEYRIRDIDDAGWAQACDDLAPAFAGVPGLVNKVWLHGEGDARGGVYLWVDKAAYEDFLASDLGKAVGSHPNIAELTMRDYAVDEAPTRVTRGVPAAVG